MMPLYSDIANRKNVYAPKENDEKTTCLNFNTHGEWWWMRIEIRIPNMGSIIHKYKHLLNLDPALKKLVRADSVFVSHRKNQTIGGMLVHNKYRTGGTASREKGWETTASQIPESGPASMPAVQEADNAGCHACKKCYVFKQNFLSPCSEFNNSHHSKQIFPITKYLNVPN